MNYGSGVCDCKAGTYEDTSGSVPICVACTQLGCLTCTSLTVCTSCNSYQFWVRNGTVCLCTIGRYFSVSTSSCAACAIGCSNCSSGTNCTQCSIPILIIQNGTCNCPAGTYKSTTTGAITCDPCSVGCLSCSNLTNCTLCDALLLRTLQLGMCICQVGSYTFTNGSVSLCQACPTGCSACASATNCTTCSPSYNFSNNTCIISLPIITFTAAQFAIGINNIIVNIDFSVDSVSVVPSVDSSFLVTAGGAISNFSVESQNGSQVRLKIFLT